MEAEGESGPGMFTSLRRLLKTVLDIAENRLDLLLLELQESRWRFIYAFLLSGLVLILSLMTLMVPTLAVVVWCVVEKRLDLVVVLTLVYLAATAGFFLRLRSWLRNWTPFSATVAELKKDKACLDDKS